MVADHVPQAEIYGSTFRADLGVWEGGTLVRPFE